MDATTLAAIYLSVSTTFGLPDGLLSAVCFTESRHVVTAVHHDDGGSESLGVCQIKYETAKALGFKGSPDALMSPRNNIYFAGSFLRRQLDRYGQDVNKAVSAYNLGSYRSNAQGAPMNADYVNRVLTAWRQEQ